MKEYTIKELLGKTTYPGRGIIFGRSPIGQLAYIGYFIMGRSVNSRNRVFVPQGDGSVITRAFDESKMSDPSLIIYAPVRVPSQGVYVVTNGDQTDTVCDFLKEGKTFEDALETRTFEPDAPNFTPRISGILLAGEGKMSCKMAILKAGDAEGKTTERIYWNYDAPENGVGRFLHTYMGDGNPLPSFEGEPEKLKMPESIETFTRDIWDSLDEDNKISLYTACIELDTGAVRSVSILNKNV